MFRKGTLVFVAVLCASCVGASAEAQGSVKVTDEIPYGPNDPSVGATFYTTTVQFNYSGSGPVYWSSTSDGKGATKVDDAADISVSGSQGTRSRTFDYSPGCSQNTAQAAQDISSLFSPGQNSVSVRLYDECGGFYYSSVLWLAAKANQARVAVSRSPIANFLPGESGMATFSISVLDAFDQPITVHYGTTDGSAQAARGWYTPAAGVLTFNPGGPSRQEVPVHVHVPRSARKGDAKTFSLILSQPSSNATLAFAVGDASIHIWDDLGQLINIDGHVYLQHAGKRQEVFRGERLPFPRGTEVLLAEDSYMKLQREIHALKNGRYDGVGIGVLNPNSAVNDPVFSVFPAYGENGKLQGGGRYPLEIETSQNAADIKW